MAASRLIAPALAVVAALVPGSVLAGDAAEAHRSWQECLGHATVTGASFTGRELAVDAALRACRGAETAYLAALSSSPLLDADDIAQARPELVARARARLLDVVNAGPRPVMR